jgi:hypothetical protein
VEPPLSADARGFLAGYSPEVRAIALRLRTHVLAVVPGANEQLDLPARMLAYGHSRTYKGLICVIMPLKVGVNLGFPRGAALPDPEGLLQGTGKRARHVRVESLVGADAPALRDLIAASALSADRG